MKNLKVYLVFASTAVGGLTMAMGLGACGDDKDSGSSEAGLCDDVKKKVEECKLQSNPVSCGAEAGEVGNCSARCFNKAPCSEITSGSQDSAFAHCLEDCLRSTVDGG